MSEERGFLHAICEHPADDTARLVYADWLDERGDPRSAFVRLHAALRSVAPDHVQRVAGETELSQLRKGLPPAWLAVIEPERSHLSGPPPVRPRCQCFHGLGGSDEYVPACEFHHEPQDTECRAWKRLCELVEVAAADGREEFAPLHELPEGDSCQIVTLPPTIRKLTRVKRLRLCGDLIRIPTEIGQMTALTEFDTYMSYRLHWYPYEITRCRKLRASAVSTRALYGNFKYRPPFPRLEPGMYAGRAAAELPLTHAAPGNERNCSVCDRPFTDRRQHRVWVSLRVATDVLPLLVNACSDECVGQLPTPPDRYVPVAHRGGPDVRQPAQQYA